MQGLAYEFALADDQDAAEARLAKLGRFRWGCRPLSGPRNGPYLVTNAELLSWLGVPHTSPPQMALCRCGASKLKPYCDGSHDEIGFADEKDPNRTADRRDTYVGQQVTIFDNRGTCAHSGFCSDRLRTAFRLIKSPSSPRAAGVWTTSSRPSGVPLGRAQLASTASTQQVDQTASPRSTSREGPALSNNRGDPARGC